LLIAAASSAFAQNAVVRVTVERANVWRASFVTVATVVRQGTELDVIGRQGDWLEVELPPNLTTLRETGFIARTQVTLVSGTIPESRPPAPRGDLIGPSARQAPLGPPRERPTGLRAFADVSYNWFLANDTFRGVIGQPGSPFVGGGAEFRWRDGLFVQGSARWLRRTGSRTFVFEDETFDLGLEDTVTIVPLAATVGYRWREGNSTSFVGGGIGQHLFKEVSDFSDPDEDVSERFTSYHIVIGVEMAIRRSLAGAVEVQYTHVPDALNTALSENLNEHNLGGTEVRFKLLFGR
jgi:opacity protein-like surface antigen